MRLTREMFTQPYQRADGRLDRPPIERYLRGLRPDGDCLVWTRSTNGKGYGQTSYGGRMVYVHRVAWALAKGSLEESNLVLHHCDNPPCANPEHLFVGDHKANTADMMTKGRHVQSMKPTDPATLAEVVRLSGLGWSTRRIGRGVGLSSSYVSKLIRASREAS